MDGTPSEGDAPKGDAPEGNDAETSGGRKGVHDFKVGEIIDGKVRNKGKGTVWVDIGIPKGAWLLGEKKDKFRLTYGEPLEGLRVDEVDIEKGWISVTLPNLEELIKDRPSTYKPPRNKTETPAAAVQSEPAKATAGGASPKTGPKTASIRVGGNKGTTSIGLGVARTLEVMIGGVAVSNLDVDYETGKIVIGLGAESKPSKKKEKAAAAKSPAEPKAKAKAKPAPQEKPKPTAEELAELEDLEVGATLKGKVATKNRGGVWVDIGKTHDARVKLLTKIGDKLQWGEELDVTILTIDKETARVTVTLSEQDQATIFGREVAKTPLDNIQVGETVSGYVASANRFGIFVDVGAERDGLLQRDGNNTRSLRNGDKLDNLKVVDVNLTARTMTLSLPEGSQGSGDEDEF